MPPNGRRGSEATRLLTNVDPASIRLVAISKTFPADYVSALADAGQVDFGENKVQEALQKMDATSTLALRWNLRYTLAASAASGCFIAAIYALRW